MTKKIIALWAEDEQGLIGLDNGLPWFLPKELQHFKKTTMGQAILMGRVTFDGMNRRILPGRQTLILTHDDKFSSEGVSVLHSVEQVLEWFKAQDENLYIVGGASIYKAFEPHYDKLIRTTVHSCFKGDTYFPKLDLSVFATVSEETYYKDDKNAYNFTITTFEKKIL